MKRRSLALLLGGALLLASCAGTPPTSSEGEEIVLRVWDQFTRDDGGKLAAEKLYAQFEAAHPGVTIEFEHYPYEDIGNLIKTALSSGTGPDVMYYDSDQSAGGLLAKSNLIMPLTEFDKKYGWSDRFSPAALTWTTYSGALYGLGLESEVNGFLVNNDLFEELGLQVPQTFAELPAVCAAAAKAGHIALSYTQGPPVIAKDQYQMMMNNLLGADQVAEKVLSGDEGFFDTDESVRALTMWYSDLDKAGCFGEGVNGLAWEETLGQFVSGQALMLPGGSWWVGSIDTRMPDTNVTFMPFPSIDGGVGRFYPGGVGSAWMISAQTKQAAMAAELLDFMFSEEAAPVWVKEAGFVLPVEFDTSSLNLTPLAAFATELIQSGADPDGNRVGYYVGPTWSTAMHDSFQDWVQAITAGTMQPADVAKKMQEQWDKDHG